MLAIQTLPTNIAISIFYSLFGILVFYIYKNSLKPLASSNQNSEHQKTRLDIAVYPKIMAKAYLKKCTIGSFFNQDKKYLLSELLIFSIFGVSCLHINHIILWPCALGICTLILISIVRQLGIHYFSVSMLQNSQKNHPQISDLAHIDSNIEISEVQSITVNALVSQSSKNTLTITIQQRNRFQIMFLFIQALLTLILMSYTIFTLSKSISNSGYLNITSVILVVFIDFAIRIAFGSVMIGMITIMRSLSLIDLQSNSIIQIFCKEDIFAQVQKQKQNMEQKEIEYLTGNKKNPVREESSIFNSTADHMISKLSNTSIKGKNLYKIDDQICQDGDQQVVQSQRQKYQETIIINRSFVDNNQQQEVIISPRQQMLQLKSSQISCNKKLREETQKIANESDIQEHTNGSNPFGNQDHGIQNLNPNENDQTIQHKDINLSLTCDQNNSTANNYDSENEQRDRRQNNNLSKSKSNKLREKLTYINNQLKSLAQSKQQQQDKQNNRMQANLNYKNNRD